MLIIWITIFILVVIGHYLQEKYPQNPNQTKPPPSAIFSIAGRLLSSLPEIADLDVSELLVGSIPEMADLSLAQLLPFLAA